MICANRNGSCLVLLCAFVLAGFSCKRPPPDTSGGPSGPCGEPTRLEFTPAADDELAFAGPFEVTSSLAYHSGLRIRGTHTARAGHLVFANYRLELGPYKFFSPKDPTQWAILLSFKTESREVRNEHSFAEYRKMPLEPGVYDRMGYQDAQRSFQVAWYSGGKKKPVILTGNKAGGKAELTVANDQWLCGSVDFTSEKGSRLKGTFAVKVEKDYWGK